MATQAETYAQNLWQFSNVITGFTVAQAIVVTLAMANSNTVVYHIKRALPWPWISALVAGAFAILFVLLCQRQEKQLLKPLDSGIGSTITWVTIVQCAIIFLTDIGLAVVIYNAQSSPG
jgi:cytochrome bd-type quinol oxidase subunit 2